MLLDIESSFLLSNIFGVQFIFGLGDALSLMAFKTTLQGSYQNKNIVEKSKKWKHSLTTVPVPYSEIPFTSGKITNFSVIVLSS